MSARLVTPTRVPTVSKKSTKKKENITIQKFGLARPEKSIFMNVGMTDGGAETKLSGAWATPRGMATAVITSMPMRIAPLMFRACSTAMMKKPAIASPTSIVFRFPSPTRTASSLTMMPAPCRPMNAIKTPIPAAMPIFSDVGMSFTMLSRSLVRVSSMKRIPSIKMAASATSHDMPIPSTTPKAKKALSPMPGARAIG